MDILSFLGIYGAIVSTVALAWNIINALSQYKGKIRLERRRMLSTSDGKLKMTMSCRVTNIGRSQRHLEMPMLTFKNPRDMQNDPHGYLLFLQPISEADYPKELKPGEIFEIDYDLDAFHDTLFKLLDRTIELCFQVQDTHGKKYASEKFTVGDIRRDVEGTRSIRLREDLASPN